MICRLYRPGARHAWSALRIFCTVAVVLAAGRLHAQASAAPSYSSVVRARPADAPVEDAAADASVISDDRTPRSGESVPQLLSELPGVTINRTGGIGSLALVSLRGSTWDQVGVYVDGIPLNSAQGGGVDLSTLPLGDIERIEVYRGSSPIAFGASALGGIISITTRAPRTTRADAELGLGSFGTWSAGAGGSWVSRRVRVY
ncbi:MAG TPA: TonB-dependent receptor plug domain-containing protein, partial [Polyangia bacterium]|nr:TonB-dependent receptor plug domain-containing protein [Polyangia bacterium]